MIDIDELDLLAKSATPGPWWIDSHGQEMVNPATLDLIFRTDKLMGELTRSKETGNLSRWPNDNDATFIASFNPAVAVELITRLRQAEKDAARYQWLRDGSQVCIEEFANTFRRNRDSFVDEAMQCK